MTTVKAKSAAPAKTVAAKAVAASAPVAETVAAPVPASAPAAAPAAVQVDAVKTIEEAVIVGKETIEQVVKVSADAAVKGYDKAAKG